METKKLELTVLTRIDKETGNTEVEDVFYSITLVVDKQGNLRVFNTEEDGDWKEAADCDTLIVKEILLRP